MTDPARPYAGYVYAVGPVTPDWRWRRVEELATRDPHAGRYSDDAPTLAAVRLIIGSIDPALADVRAARGVFEEGGLRGRTVAAYLLTTLTEAEVGERTGLPEVAVAAYRDIFFAVRGDDQLTRLVRLTAQQADDPLVRAAAYGPVAIEAQLALETGVGVNDLPPGLAEGFERKALMDKLYESNPAAYLRAVDRLKAIDDGLPPGVMHPRRRYTRRAGAGGDEG